MEQENNQYNCPVSVTLHLIGGKYKSLILWHLMDRTIRFSELKKIVSDATPKMLTQQLRELETDGLLIRTVYPIVPPRVEYSLTHKGKSLYPILKAMFEWGTMQLSESGTHPNCSMVTKTECSNCKSIKNT